MKNQIPSQNKNQNQINKRFSIKSISNLSNDDISAPLQKRRNLLENNDNYLKNSISSYESPISTPRSFKRINNDLGKSNKMNGYGYIKWKETVFEGEFKEDQKEGFGVYYSGKKIYMGMWKENVLWGNVIVIDGNKIKKQYWENGKFNKNLSKDTFIYFEKYVED